MNCGSRELARLSTAAVDECGVGEEVNFIIFLK
jgi:hypothetical protein